MLPRALRIMAADTIITLSTVFPTLKPKQLRWLPNDTVDAVLAAVELRRNRNVIDMTEAAHTGAPDRSVTLLAARNKALVSGVEEDFTSIVAKLQDGILDAKYGTRLDGWSDMALQQAGIGPAPKKDA